MITHIVLFKLKSGADIQEAKEKLLGLKGKIPQLKYLEVGADILRSERSYDLALYAKFDSMEDLKNYTVHPVHVAASDYIATVRESVVAIDYES